MLVKNNVIDLKNKQMQPQFAAKKLNMPIRQELVIERVNKFAQEHTLHLRLYDFLNTFAFLGGAAKTVYSYVSKDFSQTVVSGVCTVVGNEASAGVHNLAVAKATKMAKEMKKEGFNLAERKKAVRRYLGRKDYNIFYTPVFRLLSGDAYIRKIACGRKVNPAPSVFFRKFNDKSLNGGFFDFWGRNK